MKLLLMSVFFSPFVSLLLIIWQLQLIQLDIYGLKDQNQKVYSSVDSLISSSILFQLETHISGNNLPGARKLFNYN